MMSGFDSFMLHWVAPIAIITLPILFVVAPFVNKWIGDRD